MPILMQTAFSWGLSTIWGEILWRARRGWRGLRFTCISVVPAGDVLEKSRTDGKDEEDEERVD